MPLPPLVEPVESLSPSERARTARHLVLAGLGELGQRRLAAAHVAVVGAGGLGSPVVLALAAAGIGTLTVIDDDVVDLSNLQRQVMHRRQDAGIPKVESAVRAASDLSDTVVTPVRERLTAGNAVALLSRAHLVIDGSDLFETREAVATATESLGIPLVWGTVQEFDAQITVFWSTPPVGEGVRLGDLYPAGSAGDVPTCADVGVLGALCLQVGSLMALEAIKLITGIGDPLLGRVIVIDGLRARQREVPLRASRAASSAPPAREPQHPITAVGPSALGDTLVIDVREAHEVATGMIPGARHIPLADLLADPGSIEGPVVVVCQTAIRSRRAAEALRDAGVEASILAGGMESWDGGEVDPVSDLRSVEEQLALVLSRVHPVDVERMPVGLAVGWTLRGNVRAGIDVPVFDNSAMDGFAVRFDDVTDASSSTPVRLRVVADLPAGTALDPALAPGEARPDHDGIARADLGGRRRSLRRHPRRSR